MAINFTTAFNQFRDIIDVLDNLHTYQGTTLKTDVDALLATIGTGLQNADKYPQPEQVVSSYEELRDDTNLASSLRDLAETVLVRIVYEDSPRDANTSQDALAEFLRQMDGSATVDASEPTLSAITHPDTNVPLLVLSLTRGDGKTAQNVIAETMNGRQNGDGIELVGEPDEQGTVLGSLWPTGTGLTYTITPRTGGDGLLDGSFDLETQLADRPDDWDIQAGVIGTTIALTNTEVQSIVVAGSPTTGSYFLEWTNVDGDKQKTNPIPFDASAATVQTELAALTGLDGVEVETQSGASPNFTHHVKFLSVRPPGDQALLVETNSFDVGTITIAQVTAGSAHSHTFKALDVIGDGVVLHHFRRRITDLVEPSTSYAVGFHVKKSAAATGIFRVALTDGAGTVINNDEGVAQTEDIDVNADVTTSFAISERFFQTPETLPNVLYLEFKFTTVLANLAHVYFDNLVMDTAEELYEGGPYAMAYSRNRVLVPSDRYTVPVNNAREGRIQSWWGRWFGLDSLLPSATGGAETISDT